MKKLPYFLAALLLLILIITCSLLAKNIFSANTLAWFSTIDTLLFLSLNGLHHPYLDPIMYWASNKLFWFPFYAFIIYILYKIYHKDIWKPLAAIGILIAAADQIASHLLKNSVQRLRPSHEASLIKYIHLSKAGAGGLYGYVSSHAANSWALCIFLYLLLPSQYRPLKIVLFLWALLVSYSRVYNGVHYPADVLVGGVIGSLLAFIIYYLATKYKVIKESY